MKTTVSIWGVRGALPAADRAYMEYGGNTSCVSLSYDGGVLCFDAGSGFLSLMDSLGDAGRLDIRRGVGFLEQLETVTGRPYWPVGLKDMDGRVTVHEIAPGDRLTLPWEGGEIQISTLRGNHPDGSVLYRAETGGRSVTYALDCEMGGKMADSLADFARDADLLIWDANFTRHDKQDGWGHSTWEEGLAVGRAAGAEQILMTHFSRDYTDGFLREQERLARGECGVCAFAREGMVIAL